jgi:hypothetical protein
VKRNAVAAVIGLLALEIAPAPRAADNLSGTRGPIEERSHVVKVTLAPGHATLVVERTIENLGRRHDQADWSISIPETAVATRLRTRGGSTANRIGSKAISWRRRRPPPGTRS